MAEDILKLVAMGRTVDDVAHLTKKTHRSVREALKRSTDAAHQDRPEQAEQIEIELRHLYLLREALTNAVNRGDTKSAGPLIKVHASIIKLLGITGQAKPEAHHDELAQLRAAHARRQAV